MKTKLLRKLRKRFIWKVEYQLVQQDDKPPAEQNRCVIFDRKKVVEYKTRWLYTHWTGGNTNGACIAHMLDKLGLYHLISARDERQRLRKLERKYYPEKYFNVGKK